MLLELSAIASRQGEGDRAREVLESALEAATKSDFEQERLERTLRARGDDETLVRVLEAKLARLGESPAPARALGELAEVLADRLGRPEQALPVRLRAVAIDPRSAAAHDAALALARAVGGVERYVDGATALVGPRARGGRRAAGVLAARCASAASPSRTCATTAGRRRSTSAPSSSGCVRREVLRALDRVYERLEDRERQGAHPRAARRGRGHGGRPARRERRHLPPRRAAPRLGATRSTRASRCSQNALDLDPQLDRAEETLRQAPWSSDPSHRRLLDLYEHVGRQPGHERALFEALELRSPPAGERRRRPCARRSRSRCGIGDPALAESLLERFVESEQTAAQNVGNLAWALGALASLREAAGDVPARGRAEARRGPHRGPRGGAQARRSRWRGSRPTSSATSRWRPRRTSRCTRADPADREAWEPLAAVYRRMNDARKLADLLGTVVDYVDDARERGRLRLERVRTMMQGLVAAATREAAPLLREIVDEDATQVEAALMLAAILERTGRHATSWPSCSRAQIEAAKDRQRRGVDRVARAAARRAARADATACRRATSTTRGSTGSRRAASCSTRSCASSTARATRASGPTCRSDGSASSRARRPRGWRWRSRLRASELGRRRPRGAGARARVPRAPGERARCATGWRARSASASEWRKLAELCVLDASARVDAGERVARLREAAVIWRTELARPAAGGGGAAPGARGGAGGRVAPARPGRHAGRGGRLRGRGAGAVVGDRVAAAEAARRARRCSRRARACGRRRGDAPGRSRTSRRRSPSTAPRTRRPLAEQLERSRAEAAATPATRRRCACCACGRRRCSRTRGTSTGRARSWSSWRKQDPKDRAVLRTLAEPRGCARAMGRGERRAAAAGRPGGGRRRGGDRAAPGRRVRARGAPGRRARRPRAGAARGARRTARVRERLERVYEQTGAWHELADLALEDARASGDVAERFAQLLRAGTLLLERAGDPGAAIAALEEARALRPADPECAGQLADALTLSGRAQEALGAARADPRALQGQAHEGARTALLAARARRALPGRRAGRGAVARPVARVRLAERAGVLGRRAAGARARPARSREPRAPLDHAPEGARAR